MKRFLCTSVAVLLAACMLAGCGKKTPLVDVAGVRLDQDDPEASLKLALKGMTQLQLEMSPGQRYLLADYDQRAQNNFEGYIVCGRALELLDDPHGAAMAYWAAANYMRRIPFSPVRKGTNMRLAYNKLAALARKHNWTGSAKLVQANLALANVYANSPIVANQEANFQNRWTHEQRLIKAMEAARVKYAIALGKVVGLTAMALFNSRDRSYQWKLRNAQRELQIATAEYDRAKANLDAVKVGAPPENFPMIRQGNFPATMSMHYFSNFGPNRAANANAVARALGGATDATANAVANAAASGNTGAMISQFAQFEQQAYAQEAAAP